MTEPDNHTGWVDSLGDTWVRLDEAPGRNGGTWYPITDGPGFEARVQDGVGAPRPWSWMDDYAPFTPAGPERTARALALVRAEVAQ